MKADDVHSSFFCKSLIMDQLNLQGATAENEEQYTLSNIIYIAYQIHTIFIEVFLGQQLFLKVK